jgi:hypothetical protein
MSEHENRNKIIEISIPSSATIGKTIDSNYEKEIEKKDNEENLNQENIQIPVNEEQNINKSEEQKILKDEQTQNDENLLNNSLEKKEKEMKEEEINTTNNNNINNEINNIINDETTNNNNDIINNIINNINNETINDIKNDVKSDIKNDIDKNPTNNNYNSEEINIITNNEVKEDNTTNHNDLNSNIQKLLNLSNTDIMNLVKSQSYLTNLPISKERPNEKDKDIKKLKLKKETKKTYNSLKEKENSICMEINAIKQKKQKLENFSYEMLGSKNIVDNNIINSELKKLKTSENNLLEKLESVKQQIVNLIDNDKQLDRKEKIRTFLEKYNFLEGVNDFNIKTKALDSEISKSRKNHIKDIEKSILKKENEINKQIEEQKKLKDDFIKEFRKKEQEIIHKRKMEVDEKMKEAKKFIKNTYNYDPKKYLYNRLANQFEENEKKFLQSHKLDKRKVSGIEEISIVKRRIIECKYELEKRRIEKTNEMKELWHSRSVAVAKYPSNILKQINEYELKKNEEEEKQKMKKLVLSKEKERFVKENINLPPICEKLKMEREKRLNTYLNLEGKERVKRIKNEFDKKIKNRYSSVEEAILKKIETQKASRDKRLIKYKELETSGKMIKSASDVNINKYNNLKVKNLMGNSLSPDKIRKRKPNEINYLEQLRKEKKIYSKNYINWNKELNNIQSEKGGSIDNIKKQIDYLDEKFQMEKNLIKLKGGYINNQELGNEMNNLIINSIRGKLALMEKMDI